MKTTVIIVAAGMGRRMGTETTKQLICIGDQPIIWHTLNAFQAMDEIQEIILVTKDEEKAYITEAIIKPSGFNKVSSVVTGGEERSDSVKNGLDAVVDADVVLVHDGARPFIDRDSISRLLKGVDTAGSAVLALPVKDTIKCVDINNEVIETYDRSMLWAVQTPQGFRVDVIREAFRVASSYKGLIYDDAMMVEISGVSKTKVVMGNEKNIKITTPFDLIIGEAIYKQNRGEANV